MPLGTSAALPGAMLWSATGRTRYPTRTVPVPSVAGLAYPLFSCSARKNGAPLRRLFQAIPGSQLQPKVDSEVDPESRRRP